MVINLELYLAFLSFAVFASITPGPNNFMVMASGAAFGWKRTLPHIAGILSGFVVMVLLVGLGADRLIGNLGSAVRVAQFVGVLWLLWMGYKILRALPSLMQSNSQSKVERPERPMTFFEAALFQWINPKSLGMVAAIVASFSGIFEKPTHSIYVISMTFLVVGPSANLVWTLFGDVLSRVVFQGKSSVWLYLLFFVVLLASAIMVVLR